MAFSHGSTARFLAGGQDLSSATSTVSTPGDADVADVTGFGNTAKVYIAGVKDAKLSASGFLRTDLNDLAWSSSDLHGYEFFGAQDNTVCFSHYPYGDAVGSRGKALIGSETAFTVGAPIGDAASYSVEAQSRVGAEPVISHTTGTSYVTAGTAAVVDNAAASTNGAAGYLHGLDLSAGTAVVKLQHSSDNVTFVDLITFADVPTPRSCQRVTAAGTVRRYTRATWAVTGGSAIFHAGLARL